MVDPSDEEYKNTKMIKQGKSSLGYPFNELASWISMKHGVKPLNITYDIIVHKDKPSLHVIFEQIKETRIFNDKKHFWPEKNIQQEISDQFIQLTKDSPDYRDTDHCVLFETFEPIARVEANKTIPSEQIEALQNRIKHDELWLIKKYFHTAVFFFYTKTQANKYRNTEIEEKFTREYFKLLKNYDEFDYIDYNEFDIIIDSKESFDDDYKSTWQYYYM